MSTISSLSQDLVNRLLTITELDGAVSVGLVNDPKSTNEKNIPIPFAVVRFQAERSNDLSPNTSKRDIDTFFAIAIHVKNGSETILNDESFPLLDKVRTVVSDASAKSDDYDWVYTGGAVAQADVDRITYVQYYKVETSK